MKFLLKLSRVLALAIATLLVCLTSIAYAGNDEAISDNTSQTEDKASIARSEVTGYKYIYIDGVKYKRLWSYTYGYWIDDAWTPA